METKKILLSSFDYPPRLGGVAKCSSALKTALQTLPNTQVQVCAPQQITEIPSERPDFAYAYNERPELAFFSILIAKHRALKEWKPEIVLDLLWFPDGLASYLLSFFHPKLKYAVIVHGMEILESNRTWKKRIRKGLSFLKRKVFQNAVAIFPVSEFTKQLLQKEFKTPLGQAQSLRTLPFRNGVDAKAFAVKNQTRIQNSTNTNFVPIFFSLARLEDYKGIDKALEALAILKNRGKKFQYRIGGFGPDLERLQKLTHQWNLQKEVTFLGKLSDQVVLEEYQNCDAFVLLSRIDLEAPNVEGFGLVYLEAALCEKPSLGPNEGGPTDAIVHGETGILVDPRNEREIAKAMELFFDPSFCHKLGSAARKRALGFSWIHSAELIAKGLHLCAE